MVADVLDAVFGGGSAPAAVRRPIVQVAFGSASAEEWAQALVWLRLEAGAAPAVDVVELCLAAGPGAPTVASGDTGSVALGYQDNSTAPVFAGQVDAVRYALDGTLRVTAVNGGALLARLRLNQSYEQRSAGQIVQDLAGRAGVSAGTIDDGIDYPFYVVDDRRSAYAHVAALARASGLVARFTAAGELTFAPAFQEDAVQTFTYGVDVLTLHVTQGAPLTGAYQVIGEGAAGSQGQDAAFWLVKDPQSVTARSGDGDPFRQTAAASLRSADAVQSAADGALSAAQRADTTGRLVVAGAPAVTVGSVVKVAGAPQDALNGPCHVLGVRHYYAKHAGFTTHILFGKASAGAGGLLSAAGGLL
jgi:phage protein D